MSGRRYNRPGQHYLGSQSQNRGASNTYGEKVMSTLYNPFSIKNNNPKWPDGLANFSVGQKQQFASEMYGQNICLVLFPGSNNWVVGWDADDARKQVVDDGTVDGRHSYISLNHGDDRNFDIGFWYNDMQIYWDMGKMDYSAWRGVSYAMKVRCCNTDGENGGWFEAVRLTKNWFNDPQENKFGLAAIKLYWDAASYGISPINKYPADPGTPKDPVLFQGQALPVGSAQKKIDDEENWNEKLFTKASYAVGNLKDLGDFMFQLNPEKKINQFQSVHNVLGSMDGDNDSSISLTQYDADGADPKLYANRKYVRAGGCLNLFPNKELPGNQRMDWQETLLSDSFDGILIRIHAYAYTRVLVHSVACAEFLCGEFSKHAQYQTVAYANNDALEDYVNFRQTKCKLAFHTSEMYNTYS
jgi:hypothetical protein